MNLFTLECAGCAAPISEVIVEKGVHRCPFCGYVNVLPKPEQTSEVKHHLYNADEELKDYEFERAYNAFAKASELDPSESKAYFGMALATNRIKYIKDVVNNRWQAICCEVSDKKFSEDKNYLRALEHATPEQREEYTSRAEEIDYIREKFAELEKGGLSYDTFICVKVSDENGGFTQDSMWANRLYDSILKSGAKPFYSEKEIGDRTGEDYEALILYALYKAKSMIIVCSNEDYLRTPWVQNEYTRYYAMLSGEEKAKNSIMIAFSEHVIERVPGIQGRIQGVDLHNFDTSQKVNEFVNKFANATERARKKAEEKAKAEAERKAKEDAQQKMLEELQKKLEKTEQKLQNGEVISAGEAKYCMSCGAKNDIDVKFCSSCGGTAFSASNEKFCMSCKQSNPISTNFCKSCGSKEFACSLEERERILAKKAEAERLAKEEAERVVREKAEAYKKAKEKVEAERLAKIQARKNWFKKYKFVLLAIAILLVAALTTVIVISLQPKIVYKEIASGYIVSELKNHDKLKTVEIPNTYKGKPVVAIGNRAFKNCSNLTSIVIPNSITSIENYAFDGCSSLESITIPDSVTSIGCYAFYRCASITSVTIPDGITSIEDGAFLACTSLKSITIPNSVTSIGNYAFDGCSSLESITIPNSVTSIGNYAFNECTSLTNIIIPNSVTSIGGHAFHGCTLLETIYCEHANISWGSNWKLGCDATVIGYTTSGSNATITDYLGTKTELVIPNKINGCTVTSIGNSAFQGCVLLTSIIIPDSVTTINSSAFQGCIALTSIAIPNSTTSIGGLAFRGCISLKNVTISDNVTSIGAYTFENCTSLTSITIHDSVTLIGNYAFRSCTSLATIYCEAPSAPASWGSYWNSGSDATVVWDCKNK